MGGYYYFHVQMSVAGFVLLPMYRPALWWLAFFYPAHFSTARLISDNVPLQSRLHLD